MPGTPPEACLGSLVFPQLERHRAPCLLARVRPLIASFSKDRKMRREVRFPLARANFPTTSARIRAESSPGGTNRSTPDRDLDTYALFCNHPSCSSGPFCSRPSPRGRCAFTGRRPLRALHRTRALPAPDPDYFYFSTREEPSAPRATWAEESYTGRASPRQRSQPTSACTRPTPISSGRSRRRAAWRRWCSGDLAAAAEGCEACDCEVP
jgi:hypothetical protein